MAAGNEFSRIFLIDHLPEGGLRFEIDANPAERAALAERFGLLALDALGASGWIVAGPLPGSVAVDGRLTARATQSCIVTLEPVPVAAAEAFRRLFVPAAAQREVEVDPLADEPEPLPGRHLDVGEIVAEELALALDPYPRAPGADDAVLETGDDEPRGPFAGLARRRGG